MKIEILIKKIRLEQNMTLETLSKLSGISKGHLSKIERQEREPKLSTLIQIALALKVDIKELYKIIPWHNKNVSFFIFVKEKGTFIKGCPNATLFIVSIHKEL